MEFKTQMEAAKHGFVTKEAEQAAKDEGIGETELLGLLASGRAVIPANRNHKSLRRSESERVSSQRST